MTYHDVNFPSTVLPDQPEYTSSGTWVAKAKMIATWEVEIFRKQPGVHARSDSEAVLSRNNRIVRDLREASEVGDEKREWP